MTVATSRGYLKAQGAVDGLGEYLDTDLAATLDLIDADMVTALAGSGVIASGNLAFTGLAQRLTADMSHSTLSNRFHFQTSTPNSATNFAFIPNGTNTAASVVLNNASDPNNAGRLRMFVSGAGATIDANAVGTGTPITTLTFAGFTSYAFGAKITTVASAAAAAGLNLPTGAAPTSPVAGDLWSEGTSLKFRDSGGTTRTLTWT